MDDWESNIDTDEWYTCEEISDISEDDDEGEKAWLKCNNWQLIVKKFPRDLRMMTRVKRSFSFSNKFDLSEI
ncbi:hypothetical protein Tco_0347085 [Tanacetum coccineum]